MPRHRRNDFHAVRDAVVWIYAEALCKDDAATLDDLREAVTTIEDTERVARRVFGGEHPLTTGIEVSLRNSRVALRAREAPPTTA